MSKSIANYTMRRSQYAQQAMMCNTATANPVNNPYPSTHTPYIFQMSETPHSWPPTTKPPKCSTLIQNKIGNYKMLKATPLCDQ